MGKSFLEVAREWYRAKGPRPASEIKRIKKYILPGLGRFSIEAIEPPQVLHVCRVAEQFGYIETAWRVKGTISLIFRFAIASGYAGSDPTTAIGDALRAKPQRHYPTATTPEAICRIVEAVKSYQFPVIRAALLFSILTFARPGEVQAAEWSEFERGEGGPLWRVPADKTKTGTPRLVPLSRQAVGVLGELWPFVGGSRWVFPSHVREGHISGSGPRMALDRLRRQKCGNVAITPHGFRAMASTVLNELGCAPDVIECQLGHKVGGSVRAAYNHAQYLPQRRRLMQLWADWLDGLPAYVC